MTVTCVGVDLAWGERARTGVAVLGRDGRLVASTSVLTTDEVVSFIDEGRSGDLVVAIDAPLIVTNQTGRRPCEAEVAAQFGRFHAGPHASNLGRPWFNPPRGAVLASRIGASMDPSVRPGDGRSVAIEVYPHPAMVSLFRLDRVIPYKHKQGRDIESLRAAFVRLMGLMERELDGVLQLRASARWSHLRHVADGATRKSQLRAIEDEVDAIFCAYLAWAWAHEPERLRVYGDAASGYILTFPPPEPRPRPHTG